MSNLDNQRTKNLLAQWREGDDQALATIWQENHGTFIKHLKYKFEDGQMMESDAEDLVSETYLHLIKGKRGIKHPNGLLSALNNRAIDLIRKNATQKESGNKKSTLERYHDKLKKSVEHWPEPLWDCFKDPYIASEIAPHIELALKKSLASIHQHWDALEQRQHRPHHHALAYIANIPGFWGTVSQMAASEHFPHFATWYADYLRHHIDLMMQDRSGVVGQLLPSYQQAAEAKEMPNAQDQVLIDLQNDFKAALRHLEQTGQNWQTHKSTMNQAVSQVFRNGLVYILQNQDFHKRIQSDTKWVLQEYPTSPETWLIIEKTLEDHEKSQPKQCLAWELRRIQGLKYEQISRQMGIATGSAHSFVKAVETAIQKALELSLHPS